MQREEEKLLSWRELALILALVLPIFFFEGGPIWTHAFRIDAAVYWSYAPIPLLVLLILLRRRAWTLSGFAASTVIALGLKYMITTSIAFALWSTNDPPPLPRAEPPAYVKRERTTHKQKLDEASMKVRKGRVIARDGTPIEGAWVYADPSIGAFEGGPDTSMEIPMEIAVHDHQFTPPIVVITRDQPLIFRSGDRMLHTVRGVAADGAPAFHYPLVPGKEPAPVRVAYASGRLELSCAVHEKSRAKQRGAVIVLDHPFFTKSGKDGLFVLERVPPDAKLFAVAPDGTAAIINDR